VKRKNQPGCPCCDETGCEVCTVAGSHVNGKRLLGVRFGASVPDKIEYFLEGNVVREDCSTFYPCQVSGLSILNGTTELTIAQPGQEPLPNQCGTSHAYHAEYLGQVIETIDCGASGSSVPIVHHTWLTAYVQLLCNPTGQGNIATPIGTFPVPIRPWIAMVRYWVVSYSDAWSAAIKNVANNAIAQNTAATAALQDCETAETASIPFTQFNGGVFSGLTYAELRGCWYGTPSFPTLADGDNLSTSPSFAYRSGLVWRSYGSAYRILPIGIYRHATCFAGGTNVQKSAADPGTYEQFAEFIYEDAE
jgi:hypothetical protein